MTRKLNFSKRAPLSGRARKLVVFLHGYGADGADLLGLADPLAPHMPDCAFVAPDAPERPHGSPFGWQWFPIPWLDGSSQQAADAGLQQASADLNAFLDARLADEGLTPADLIVLGFSQGAMMALHILPRRPTPVAGIISISGRLLKPELLIAEALSKPPVFLIHGDQDQVVPFTDMKHAGEALHAVGFQTYAHVMRGTGHGIAPDGLSMALGFMKERFGP